MILRASIIMLIHRFPDQTYWLQDKQDGLSFFFAYHPLICQPNKLSKRSENLARLFCSNLIANLRYKWLTLKLEFRRGKDMNPAAICANFLKLRWSKSRRKINKGCEVEFMIYVCPLYSYFPLFHFMLCDLAED